MTEKSSTILPERIIVYAGKNNLARDDGESQEKSVSKRSAFLNDNVK